MAQLMRCPFCGLLQDEPAGVKECARCGGGLEYDSQLPGKATYVQVQMELDQVAAPANQNVERYLLVTIRTPAKIPDGEAAPSQQRPPVNFAAVLDVSGSMQGEKIQNLRAAAKLVVDRLSPQDLISIVAFSDRKYLIAESQPVTDKQALMQRIDRIRDGGGTAISGGMAQGLAELDKALSSKRISRMLLLTDGQTFGDEKQCKKLGKEAGSKGIVVNALGLGDDWNEDLLDEVAEASGGKAHVLVTNKNLLIVADILVVNKGFADANPETRAVSGTGLGLYLTRAIVRAHGGRCWVDSVPGQGATFYVALPRETGLALWRGDVAGVVPQTAEAVPPQPAVPGCVARPTGTAPTCWIRAPGASGRAIGSPTALSPPIGSRQSARPGNASTCCSPMSVKASRRCSMPGTKWPSPMPSAIAAKIQTVR